MIIYSERRPRAIVFVMILSSFFSVSVSVPKAEELIILTEERPPFNYHDPVEKKAAGYSVELVEELLKRTGIKAGGNGIQVYPWARAFNIVQETKNAMLFSMTRTPEREPLFKWVGPIADRTVWFWRLRERNEIQAATLEEAKLYSVSGVTGYPATEYMKRLGFEIEVTASVERNWKKLLARRVDLGTGLELEAAYYMNRQGESIHALERLLVIDDSKKFYIALNNQTEDRVVERLRDALDQIKTDGCIKRLEDAFLK